MTDTLTLASPIADLKLPAGLAKELNRIGYTAVSDLTRHTAVYLRDQHRLGAKDITAMVDALAKHGLAFANPIGTWKTCTSCPKCETCGNPRAQTAASIATDGHGRAKHIGGQLGDGPCHDCDMHHRTLVADRAMELTGRLM